MSSPKLPNICFFVLVCFYNKYNQINKCGKCSCYKNDFDNLNMICTNHQHNFYPHPYNKIFHSIAFVNSTYDNLVTYSIDLFKYHHFSIIGCCKRISNRKHSNYHHYNRSFTIDHRSLTIEQSRDISNWNWGKLFFIHVLIQNSTFRENILTVKFMKNFGPNLTSMSIINCFLEDIEPNAFNNFTKLKLLRLNHNKIKEFNGSLFDDSIVSLWNLDLSFNKLTTLSKDLFTKLASLTHLNLNKNPIHTLAFDTIKPIWNSLIEFNILNNNLKCADLCWAFEKKTFPHPRFFDSLKCSMDSYYIMLGELSFKDLKCLSIKSINKTMQEFIT